MFMFMFIVMFKVMFIVMFIVVLTVMLTFTYRKLDYYTLLPRIYVRISVEELGCFVRLDSISLARLLARSVDRLIVCALSKVENR